MSSEPQSEVQLTDQQRANADTIVKEAIDEWDMNQRVKAIRALQAGHLEDTKRVCDNKEIEIPPADFDVI